MNNWWESSPLFIHFHPFIDSVTHSLTNPLLSLCLTVSRLLETQPVRERQSCRNKGSPEWSVLRQGSAETPTPRPAWLVALVRLLGEGQAPEEMGRSPAARPHLLVCGMWGPCRVLSPTPLGSASVPSLRTGMKPSSPLLSWLSLHQEIQQGTSSSGLASSCPISGAWPPGSAPGQDESGRGPGRPRCRLRRGQGVLPWGSMGAQLR